MFGYSHSHYQIHGKKDKRWLSRARGIYEGGVQLPTPPLLEAAFQGSLASVEWFLSDAPARLYKEFAAAHSQNKYIKHLETSSTGGFGKVLQSWLSTRSKLLMSEQRKPLTAGRRIRSPHGRDGEPEY